ncbi:MAG: GNAT family N-acetyltransferase [Pseudomonadota bacterium]
MDVTIAEEAPMQDDVRTMVKALNAYLAPLSPPEFQFQLTVEQMAGSGNSTFVARDADGSAVGMGSLYRHDEEFGEVKRMFTDERARGQGVGASILRAIEERATGTGIQKLALETGATSGFEGAWALYEKAGYQPSQAFADYPDSGFSRFYEKTLTV